MSEYFREARCTVGVDLKNTLDFLPHLHEVIEICYVVSGEGYAYCDGRKYFLKKGNVFLAFPNQVHHFEGFLKGKYYVAFIPPYILSDYANLLKEKIPSDSCAVLANSFDVSVLLRVMLKEYRFEHDDVVLKGLATALFGKTVRDFKFVSNTPHDTVAAVLEYCNRHYKEKISIEDVAKNIYVSEGTVSRVFSRKINLSFNDYVNSLRISEFLRLAKIENLSVTDAAYASGFTNLRTFNRAFKKIYKISPTEYMGKSHRVK